MRDDLEKNADKNWAQKLCQNNSLYSDQYSKIISNQMSTLVQSLSKKPNFYQERNYEKNRETTAATLESSCQNNSSNSDRAVVKSSENNFETL